MPTRPPMFRKLPNPIILGDRGFPAPETPFLSPTSVLERNLHSPKGWKNRESDGVGLGIVAALEKSGSFSASTPVAAITSPRTASGYREGCVEDPNALFRPADFLSCCYLCSKRLHGRDIYMYRGEKAFCSMECRHRQIVSDDFKEKRGTEVSEPSTEISSSPYSGGDGRLFFTGIVAA